MAPRLTSERLFLSRDGVDVFVSEEFAQHARPDQRDAVRFLYKQFCNKSSGVILNDPADYGKTVQVILFLEAVRHLSRPHPTLILCSEDNIQHWSYHFNMWTNSAKDIVDDSCSIFKKKDVFIVPIEKWSETKRRDWGIVVVDDVKISPVKQLSDIAATFRIWLCNNDLMNDLNHFSHIVNDWLIPARPFDITLYNKRSFSQKERVEREIRLDTYCQDLVLRRTDLQVFSYDKQVQQELYQDWLINKTINRQRYFGCVTESSQSVTARLTLPSAVVPLQTVSRKNKDPTGLKIKRSKPVLVDDEVKRPKIAIESATTDIAKDRLRDENIGGNVKDVIKKIDANVVDNEKSLELKVLEIEGESDKMDIVKEKKEDDNVAGNVIDEIKKIDQNVVINEKSLELKRLEIIEESAKMDIAKEAKEDDNVACNVIGEVEKIDENVVITEEISDILSDQQGNKIIIAETSVEEQIVTAKTSNEIRKDENIDKACVTNAEKTNDLMSSLKQIEEQTNKQFKGSILDSLF